MMTVRGLTVMMGKQPPPQPSLFYTRFNLDKRIPGSHPLRIIDERVDFEFVYDEVEHLYGAVGNESVPPPMILKLMLVLTLENVPSERRLMETLPMRLDWLWFLGMDLDSPIPDHSVLSKARKRWGVGPFRRFFENIVRQCLEAGLVDGSKIFCDGSLIDANASQKSIERVGVVELSSVSDELENRLEETELDHNDGSDDDDGSGLPAVKVTSRSTTDPDAAVVKKRGHGPARARYKSHRGIDGAYGVITATKMTPGDVNEAQQLPELINQHESTTSRKVQVAVADTGYGTAENYLSCADRGIEAHMRSMKDVVARTAETHGLFPNTEFKFDPKTNTYTCPAGQTLRRLQARPEKKSVRYAARKNDCQACTFRTQCTEHSRRTILRRDRTEELELIYEKTRGREASSDLRRRKHFMEGSFAISVNFGFKRCRWRRLWRAEIQDLLVATVQNIKLMARYGSSGPFASAQREIFNHIRLLFVAAGSHFSTYQRAY